MEHVENGRSLSGYGKSYEHQVSSAVAQKLLKDSPLPRMGYEILLVKLPNGYGHLALQNISGYFVLASPSHPRDNWAAAFGITTPAPRKADTLH